MKQAQKMQQEMLRMQAEQEAKTFTAASGGGMVTATVNGKHELVGIEIKPEAVDPDDVEMLQDMVIAAVNEATRAADACSKEKLCSFFPLRCKILPTSLQSFRASAAKRRRDLLSMC